MSDGAPSANSFGMDHWEKEKVQLKFEVARRTERQFAPQIIASRLCKAILFPPASISHPKNLKTRANFEST